MTAPSAFAADPLRTMRAVRLACQLNFVIEPETLTAASRAAPALRQVSPDRVGREIEYIFSAPRAAHGVRLLDRCGLIDVCFPVLVEGRDIGQPPVHLHEVYEHSLASSGWMDVLLTEEVSGLSGNERGIWEATWQGSDWIDTRWGPLAAHLNTHGTALRLAALLHDIGKPRSLTSDLAGRTRFLGHAELGAELAAEQLRQWRLPSALIERVGVLVAQHLRPGQVATLGEAPTQHALYRFQKALGDATPDACFLFLADSLGTVGAGMLMEGWRNYLAHVRQIIYWQPAPSSAGIQRLVDGNQVISATGLRPGPAIGRLLAAIHEAAATGEIATVDAALSLARRLAQDAAS